MKLRQILTISVKLKVSFLNKRCISTINNHLNREMSLPRNYFENTGLLKEGHYNLQVGAPGSKDLAKIATYFEAATESLSKSDKRFGETLQYGTMPGDKFVCDEVAKFLSRQYGQTVQSGDLMITPGASMGLLILIRRFTNPDDNMFVENPTYPVFAKYVTADKFIKTVPIPMEKDGMDLKVLQEKLEALPKKEVSKRWPFRALMYVIPTHHNPTGVNYSPEKCRKIVELARKYNLLVICDDVYNALNYVSSPSNPTKFEFSPQRLFAYDKKDDADYQGNVVSNGTLSKIVAPGLRVGWYEAPKRVIDSLQDTYDAVSGGGYNPYVSNLTAEVLKSGKIDEHVQHLRVAHKERMAAVISTVETKLGKYGVTISHPEGGYFLWIKLPENISSAEVLSDSSKNENVTFVKGEIASVVGDFSNYIRLSIAYYECAEMVKGVEGLCRSIERTINLKNRL
uniref:Uncharacterized protein YER152C n=1 Tax=Phallusia mammillata TaxID=59560 RepID=A0A6F9D686_9ASCI|nr:uncharacterized protein YER152C [Phallusia mammillata]